MKCSKPQANENERANSFSRPMTARCLSQSSYLSSFALESFKSQTVQICTIEFGTLKSNRNIFRELVKMLRLGGRSCCLDPTVQPAKHCCQSCAQTTQLPVADPFASLQKIRDPFLCYLVSYCYTIHRHAGDILTHLQLANDTRVDCLLNAFNQ